MPRARLTESGNRTVNDSRMARDNLRVPPAEPIERAGPEIFDDHVRAREQRVDHASGGSVFQIERDALLVAIDAEEVRAFAVDERGAPRARVIATAGLLDLDHPRAEIAELHRAVRARQHAREIQNRDALERRHTVRMKITVYSGSR